MSLHDLPALTTSRYDKETNSFVITVPAEHIQTERTIWLRKKKIDEYKLMRAVRWTLALPGPLMLECREKVRRNNERRVPWLRHRSA